MVAILEQAFRDHQGRVLAALISFLGDFDLAEEATQQAFVVAAQRWPRYGPPANPGAWLVATARNGAIDRLRRDRTLAAKTRLLPVSEAAEDPMEATAFPDERLGGAPRLRSARGPHERVTCRHLGASPVPGAAGPWPTEFVHDCDRKWGCAHSTDRRGPLVQISRPRGRALA